MDAGRDEGEGGGAADAAGGTGDGGVFAGEAQPVLDHEEAPYAFAPQTAS